MEKKKRVVILGAGFGGLRAAVQLARKTRQSGRDGVCEIFLIDRNGYHTYTPVLYEAATTSKESANYGEIKKITTVPVREIIAGTGINFIEADVRTLDLLQGNVGFASGEILSFDYLVLALGAETSYFDIPGMREHSLTLKTFLDSVKIRDAIFDAAQTKENVRIVVGGGGSTGVELSGEIQGWFEKLDVTLVEAGPSLLPGFPEKIVRKARKRLEKLGTKIITGEPIIKVDPGSARLGSGRTLPFDILIWTGGVKAPALLNAAPLKTEKRGRVEVAGIMECLPQKEDLELYGKVYGLGDAVCFYDESGKPVPGVARAAISQADVVAHNIWCDLLGRKDHRKYRAKKYPYVIPIGGKWAIARIGPCTIKGYFGWVLKELVEINYLVSIMPFWKAMGLWLKGIWIFTQNDK